MNKHGLAYPPGCRYMLAVLVSRLSKDLCSISKWERFRRDKHGNWIWKWVHYKNVRGDQVADEIRAFRFTYLWK